jgi:hypothetical protein
MWLELDKTTAKQILERIEWLSQHIEAITPIPLKSNLSGFSKSQSTPCPQDRP